MAMDYKKWYYDNWKNFDELRLIVAEQLKTILENEGFAIKRNFILVDSRLKKYNSFIEKILKEDDNGNRKYSDPAQITDIAGIRVVAVLLDDVKLISDLIESNFNVDYPNSIKPSERLIADKIGYRSTNYIAKSVR